MKIFIGLIIVVVTFTIYPIIALAENESYEMVSRNEKENITLYAKRMDGLFRGFKINFKRELYSMPFWISEINPAYRPQIIYEDIKKDQNKELIIILTKGYGTGVLWEDVYVFDVLNNRLNEVIVHNPLTIINMKVITKLTAEYAEVIIGDKKCTVNINPMEIKSENLFDGIGFGSIIDYEVRDNQLIVSIAGQITPGKFVGNIVIIFEDRDNMYQEKTIEFQPCQ
ncbi:hypothetical protein [Metabacillus malikii]|uniref:Uncharacterized protein n=1 Tax=Metabacillus malikii TaxID=1504265 RepID=A0ABT9ZK69_9BACI|nr:hypothetical protein [Metabacillus malikii]MDQ0232692.1 hypothetical protein [Metabacillus malikii]